MAKKIRITEKENYLERIPAKKDSISWTTDENGIVTLAIENKGVFNKFAQVFFKKPKISYIHLEEFGSFIWQLIDGEKDIIEIGKLVEEHFGEKAQPLYERLAKYFTMLDNCGFVRFVQNTGEKSAR